MAAAWEGRREERPLTRTGSAAAALQACVGWATSQPGTRGTVATFQSLTCVAAHLVPLASLEGVVVVQRVAVGVPRDGALHERSMRVSYVSGAAAR